MSSVALSGVAGAPCLRADLTIVEQTFRGETAFVVKDPATHKYFRFRPVEMGVMRLFDGRRTPDDVAAALAAEGMRLTGRAVEGFARKLASIGLLERTLAERTTLELERIRAERRRRRRPALFRGELLRMRWSLGDPNTTFDRTLPITRWMFTRGFVVASVALFAVYFLIMGAKWSAFSSAVAALYSPANITVGAVVILWCSLLVVTFIHELGHGFACKHFGGEVHEMGFMLMYFQPAFYCNVNDAWSFTSLSARLWVTAAGSWIELVVTSLAAVAWTVAQPDTLVSEIAVAVMLLGGVTAVLTNANPLLPLDGYFALTDWLEIPNLRIRALDYFGWWLRRHVLRLEIPEPATTDRERRVFLIYGTLAVAYISIVFTFIGLWVIGRAHQMLGAIGAIIVLGLILMLARHGIASWGRSIALAIRARRGERRGIARWRWPALVTLGVLLVLALLPWTLTTSGQFVVAPANTLDLTAPDSALIGAVFVREGMTVTPGAPLARLIDRDLERDLLAAGRAVDSLTLATSRARVAAASGVPERLDAERAEAVARMAALRSRFDALTLRARWGGTVTTPRVQELEGHRVEAGDRIMRVATLDALEARIALARAGAMNVRPGQVVHLMAYADATDPVDATVVSVAPAGDRTRGTIEVRVPIGRDRGWRAGATGEASVELRRSTALGVLWWNVRRRIRSDLLL
jgi:multidrug efflux pump subunit AcrA (membrane-fusion protein)